ncbi:MAG TPA: polysaccharide biosynthesis/export family protein, partial [Microvirga sp.]|nr:polysaccharide biosynthesis/export family protein [Microvirga sp.]
LAELGKIKPPTFIGRFPVGGTSAPRVIGIGDALAISIWEAGDGGLFSPGTSGKDDSKGFSRGGGSLGDSDSGGRANRANTIVVGGTRVVRLPPAVVDRTGEVTVPYAGRIKVAGLTPREIEQVIVERLRDRAIQPQALVNIDDNNANTVNVMGGRGRTGKISLTQRDDRILDVVALAGGAMGPAYDTLVRLTRGGVTGTVSLQRVINEPSENISVKPGDTLELIASPQTFTAFGASGAVDQVPFRTEAVSLAEAVARVGGPSDVRADASSVFLFRFEDPLIAQAVAPAVPAAGDGRVPLVYRINLNSPEGYFYAQTFPVRDKDTIYVANAAAYELDKFFTFLRAGSAVATDIARATLPVP